MGIICEGGLSKTSRLHQTNGTTHGNGDARKISSVLLHARRKRTVPHRSKSITKYLIVASNSLGIFYALQGDTNLAHSYFTRALHCIEKISAQGGISRFFAVAMNDLICRKANTVNNDFLNFITSRREQISPQRWNAYQDLLETKQSTMYRSLYTLFTGPYVFMY